MIKIETHASSNQVTASIARTGPDLDAAAQRGLNRGLQSAVAVAGTQFLTGPRPTKLGVRSGRLRGSLAFEITTASSGDSTSLVGRMGSNLKYAAFHEFGFHGVENVKAHSRVLSQHDAKGNPTDTRRPLIDRDSGKVIGFNKSRKSSASSQKSGFVTFGHVRAHSRRINYSGRPFIKPALEKSLPVIEREINSEIAKLNPAAS